jgi:hypothetical protein
MTAVLLMALTLFVALIYVAPSQIVAIIDSPDVGACPTMLITMSQSVFRESPAEVKQKLEAVMSLICRAVWETDHFLDELSEGA